MRGTGSDRYELYKLVFPNTKQYAGISYDTSKRFDGHVRSANRGVKLPVYDAMRKYGFENVRSVLVAVGSEDYIKQLEIGYIEKFQLRDRRYGYNVAPGGTISPMHASEVAAKVSATKKQLFAEDRELALATVAKMHTPEARAKALITIRTPEVSAKKSLKLKGVAKSPKAIANVTAALRRPETRAKLAAANAAIWANPELRAAQSERLKGGKTKGKDPAIWAAKISATLLGHPGYGKGMKFPERAARISNLVWVTNDIENRRIPKEDSLPEGWRFGRKKNRKKFTS